MTNKPLPPLHPGTMQPIGPEMLEPLFPMELIKQEVTGEKFVEIPEEVREAYKIYRPTPLYRAYGLEAVSYTHLDVYKRQVLRYSANDDSTVWANVLCASLLRISRMRPLVINKSFQPSLSKSANKEDHDQSVEATPASWAISLNCALPVL